MSIEVWQFPKSATKADLTSFLKGLGYAIGENSFQAHPAGTVYLFWSDPKDFKSTNGVDASVFPVDDEGKRVWNTQTDWGLWTRTSLWATSFDKEFQNNTVRAARKKFGGTFYNDHYGHGRYNVIEKQESTPASRGVYSVLAHLENQLQSLETALPKEWVQEIVTPQGMSTAANDPTGLLQVTKRFDPTRVVYNALVPFLVACIEFFFGRCFEILLKYDKAAITKAGQNKKVDLGDVLEIGRGELTIERVIARWYSFQNMDHIQKAYSDVLGIDVLKALRVRKRVRGKLPIMRAFLHKLIETRHGVIHHFDLNMDLDREGFLDLLHGTTKLLQHAAAEIEKKLGVPLGPG